MFKRASLKSSKVNRRKELRKINESKDANDQTWSLDALIFPQSFLLLILGAFELI